MDEIDIAQNHWELLLSARINNLRQKATGADASATECEECGVEIPEARRQAVPGCTLCVDCQEKTEANGP
ncbi:MAG: TraR/DksA family transcriptional regulator [Desulfobacteraceae bacterium]|nr:TraR/DksA family transcriptional regulator [Desulfobacteraceae bacterium]